MRQIAKSLVAALAASVLLAACESSSSSSSNAPASSASTGSRASGEAAVKAARNATLGSTILVDAQGLTLYRLSGEQNGKWICILSACVQVWHPLLAQSGAPPAGSVGSLGTVKRPDGTMQVAYQGMPLYTFAQDKQAGDVKGQGLKDVGTWNAVQTATGGSSQSTPAPASSSGGGGYGY